MREDTLNKIGAFSLNPSLKLMLGQGANHLDFRAIMDKGKILLLDLGRSDGEINRLIGSLAVTGLELAMRRRRNRRLWNLTIDEFAGYVANEGSVKALAHVFSEGRKFRMSMTVAHQDLSQLTPRMLEALSILHCRWRTGGGGPSREPGQVRHYHLLGPSATCRKPQLITSKGRSWRQEYRPMRGGMKYIRSC